MSTPILPSESRIAEIRAEATKEDLDLAYRIRDEFHGAGAASHQLVSGERIAALIARHRYEATRRLATRLDAQQAQIEKARGALDKIEICVNGGEVKLFIKGIKCGYAKTHLEGNSQEVDAVIDYGKELEMLRDALKSLSAAPSQPETPTSL